MAQPLQDTVTWPQSIQWSTQQPTKGVAAETERRVFTPLHRDVFTSGVGEPVEYSDMQIRIFDPSFAQLEQSVLTFDVSVEHRTSNGQDEEVGHVILGQSAKSLFRRIQLLGPENDILDDIHEFHQLDAMIRRFSDGQYNQSIGNVNDGSSVIQVQSSEQLNRYFGLKTQYDAADVQLNVGDANFALNFDPQNGMNLYLLREYLIGSSVSVYAQMDGTDVVGTPNPFLGKSSIVDVFIGVDEQGAFLLKFKLSSQLSSPLAEVGDQTLTHYLFFFELARPIPYMSGPVVPFTRHSEGDSILNRFSVDLNEFSFFRTGKMSPITLLRGGGLTIRFFMAKPQDFIKNLDFTDVGTNFVVTIKNMKLSVPCTNFDQSTTQQLQQMIVERGALQLATTKWVCHRGQLNLNDRFIPISEAASSVRGIVVALLPYLNGDPSGKKDPFLSSTGNFVGAQVEFMGRKYPANSIPIGPQSNLDAYDSVSIGQTPFNLSGTMKQFGSPQMLRELSGILGQAGNKSFSMAAVNEVTWGQNHYDFTTGTIADSANILPFGTFLFAFDLTPYDCSDKTGMGYNLMQTGSDLKIRLEGAPNATTPAADYVYFLLCDSVSLWQADGTCKSAM